MNSHDAIIYDEGESTIEDILAIKPILTPGIGISIQYSTHVDEREEQSEYDEWRENDDARRYREWESDNQRAC